MNAISNFTRNTQTLETIQHPSMDEWVNNLIYHDNRILINYIHVIHRHTYECWFRKIKRQKRTNSGHTSQSSHGCAELQTKMSTMKLAIPFPSTTLKEMVKPTRKCLRVFIPLPTTAPNQKSPSTLKNFTNCGMFPNGTVSSKKNKSAMSNAMHWNIIKMY